MGSVKSDLLTKVAHRANDKGVVFLLDAEALLVNWLNELIYHTEMDGELFCEFHIESFELTHLRATVRAGRGIELKKQIKAATRNRRRHTFSSRGV